MSQSYRVRKAIADRALSRMFDVERNAEETPTFRLIATLLALCGLCVIFWGV